MIGGVILSAGESKRMGIPKALLKIKDNIFINHIIDVLYNSGVGEIVTVLGHNFEGILMELDKEYVDIAKARIEHWTTQDEQKTIFDIEIHDTPDVLEKESE